MTGMRLSRWTRSISEGPPRGTIMSITPFIASISPTAAQNCRIAGFEREPAGIGSHIRPAFVDYADNTERHSDALNCETVRPCPFRQNATDRIRESGNRLEPGCDRF